MLAYSLNDAISKLQRVCSQTQLCQLRCFMTITAVSMVQGWRAGFQYPSSRVQTRPKPSDLQGEKKILSTPSFGGEVKPSVPCRRFAACKRSLNLRGSRNLGKITRYLSRPQFHLSLLGSLASLRTYRHLAAKVGTSKGWGKQWKTTPKNFPRMQCARAIPVT